MAKSALLLFTVLASVAVNGFVFKLEQGYPASKFYYIQGLDGGYLTAHPRPKTGYPYPDAGYVSNEPFEEGNLSQQWEIRDLSYNIPGKKGLVSRENNYNEVRYYFTNPKTFPQTHYYAIQEYADIAGVFYFTTTFSFDPNEQPTCLLNNGPNANVSFGPCDRKRYSSPEFRIIPVPAISA